MEESIILALRDLPFALLFALFLILSFRQREQTMTIMSEMVDSMMDTIAECCKEDK